MMGPLGMGGSPGMDDYGQPMGMGSSIPGLSQMLNMPGSPGMQGQGNPAAPAQFGGPSGGMLGGNPMSELQKHSNFATRFQRNPMSGPSRGGWGF